MKDSFYLKELDAVRGLAIVMVVVWHYIIYPLSFNEDNFSRYFSTILGLTWSGVELFFVLSGFLITNILLENRYSKNLYPVFFLRRAARILPCYLILIFIGLIFKELLLDDAGNQYPFLFGNPIPLWSYLLFLQNFFFVKQGSFSGQWFAPTWSLAIEEQFYLTLPLIVRTFPKKLFVIFIAFIFILFASFHITIPPGLLKSALKFDFLLLGSLLAIMFRNNWLQSSIFKNKLLPFFGLALYFVLTITPITYTWRSQSISLYIVYVILIGGILAKSNSLLFSFSRSKALQVIGLRSYCIYLVHQPVYGLANAFILGNTAQPTLHSTSEWFILLLSLILTLITSEFSYRLMEYPIRNYTKKFISY